LRIGTDFWQPWAVAVSFFSSRRAENSADHASQRSVVIARRGMVCTSQPLATQIGLDVLRSGGNAIDAAVAAVAMLGVVEPYNTGIGGDCFMLIWSSRERRLLALNGSGRAPAQATIDEYQRRGVGEMPLQGMLTVTVPGAVDAWCTALERCGTRSLADSLAPAIAYAEEGFPLSEMVAREWGLVVQFGFLGNEAAKRCFAPGGEPPRVGQVVRLQDLARSLRAVAEGGKGALYEGELAEKIIAFSRENGGLLSRADLAEHRSSWVEPIEIDYRGYRVCEVPPNTQGITALIALGILRHLEPWQAPCGSPSSLHRMIEAVKLAFVDRAAYVADPEHVAVPVDELLDAERLRRLAERIDVRRAQDPPAANPLAGGSDTVYLTAADGEGNVVSLINSLYGPFGSGLVVGDTGIVLQNRGRGFVLDAGHANCIAPRKRPFHTLCPAMLLEDGVPRASFGVMGADVQAQAQVQVVTNLIDHGLNVQEALDAPRFHYLGGRRLVVEDGFSSQVEQALADLGHQLEPTLAALARGGFGGGQAIAIHPESGALWGGSDRRKDGQAAGF
jgi:gamma-glutamyltranspeptidase/glutathione hydrolase